MSEIKTLEILKEAILLERRGKAFYEKVAGQTDNEAVKTIFASMAEEEQSHLDVLARQFKSYRKTGRLISGTVNSEKSPQVVSDVITDEIKEKIAAADFEAAAIGAAISMEEKAISVYKERAESAEDAEEKELYQWLADWEKQHLNLLLDIDQHLVDKIWFDNGFWPM